MAAEFKIKRVYRYRSKSSNNKQHNDNITSIVNMLLLCMYNFNAKIQRFIKDSLMNVVIYLSIVHFIIFYLISIVIDIIMINNKNKKVINCKCYL